MERGLAGQLARMLFSVFFISMVVFVLIRLSGDPADIMLAFDATPEQREALRRAYGWDQPIYVQYGRFLARAIRGDFGLSVYRRVPAMSIVFERIEATFELAFLTMAFFVVIGVSLGVLTSVLKGTVVDFIGTTMAFVGQSVPSFWLGLMLMLLFAVRLRWLPTSGRAGPLSRILPIVTLGSLYTAEIVMLVRQGMVEALEQDYVRTARAKGLSERVVMLVHVLRNVMLPVVTMVGMNFGALLGGAVITESVFAWPGLGRLALESVFKRDFPVVQAVVLFLSTSIVIVNFLVDLLYRVIDPRIAQPGSEEG